MIFDSIVADPAFADAVRDAASSGSITIITTHVQRDQIADIPDDRKEKRGAILQILALANVILTTGVALGASRLGMGPPRRRADEHNA